MRLIESKKRKYNWNDVEDITEEGIILTICEDVEVTYNYSSFWTSYGGDEDWDSEYVDPLDEGWEGYLVEKDDAVATLLNDDTAEKALERNMRNYLGDDFDEDEWEYDYDKIWEMLRNTWCGQPDEQIMSKEDADLYLGLILDEYAELSIDDAEEWVDKRADDIAERLEDNEPDWDSMPGGPDDDDRRFY